MPEAIDPSKIPGTGIFFADIASNAATIATIGASVRDDGSNVHLKWQGMAGVYSAPESPTLLGLMQPVSSQATAAGDNLEVVAAALTQFATDVEPIKNALDDIRTRAWAFREEISGGIEVRELNPQWVSSQGYQGSWNAYGAANTTTTTGGTTSEVSQYRYVTKQWHEVQEYVDRNNGLIAEVNTQQVALWDAERACANKIRALYGGAPLHAAESENDALGYGIAEIPEGTEMPWGAPVERTEGCGEATLNFVVRDFLWEGIIVGGVWGTIQGLGTLVLGYNPATGDWFSGDAYGAAWGNLGMLAAGAVIATTPPLNLLFAADDMAQQFGGDGFLPDEVSDFKDSADEALLNTGKALIAWDKWADDPGTALGESVFNVATILIPVGGAAVAGVKTASTAASVLSRMARFVDLVDPGAWAVNGTLRVGGLGLSSLDNLIGRLDLARTFDTPQIDVYTGMDSASALQALDEWGVDLNTVTARVDDGIPVLEFPGGRVELPPGAFDDAASVTAPVRESELVTSGGVRGETGPGAVNTIVDDAPVRTETGGSGESTVVREPAGGSQGSRETGGSGDSGGSGGSGSSGGDSSTGSGDGPVGSGDGGGDGDGFTRGPEHRGDPVDPDYGEPRADHGTLADQYAPPAEIPENIRHLVADPEAPYGRDGDGEPYSRAEWEERYVGPDNRPIYPGNDGAVAGTRVEYTDMSAFRRDYGDTLDRFGGDGGAFLSPEGVLFESRALPGSNLNAPYSVYRLPDELPPGVRIEVSRVAEAFGQPGGGVQVRFMHGDETLSVQQLSGSQYQLLHPADPMPHAAPAYDLTPADRVDIHNALPEALRGDPLHDPLSPQYDSLPHDASGNIGTINPDVVSDSGLTLGGRLVDPDVVPDALRPFVDGQPPSIVVRDGVLYTADRIDVTFNRNQVVHDLPEFERQADLQERSLQQLPAQRWIEQVERFGEEGRLNTQVAYRNEWLAARAEALQADSSMSAADAMLQARTELHGQVGLHGPDQVPGGDAGQLTGFGDGRVNSAIGSQWGAGLADGFVARMEDLLASSGIPPELWGDVRLNVQLHVNDAAGGATKIPVEDGVIRVPHTDAP